MLALETFMGAMTPHTRIPLNQGICGAAASSGKTVVVDDVSKDPRYLACSSRLSQRLLCLFLWRIKSPANSTSTAIFQQRSAERTRNLSSTVLRWWGKGLRDRGEVQVMKRVVAAVIEKDGKLLVCQRTRHQTMPLKWEFPGGKIEEGEQPRDALRRELEEELGIQARIGDEIVRLQHTYPNGAVVELRFFVVREYEGGDQ